MTTPAVSTRRLLAAEVARSGRGLDLARAALLVAKEEYPQLSIDLYLARLDQLAEDVKDRLADETAPPVVLDELLSTLYQRNGFRGNRDAYFDPRNSFLNDVLDRRLGIPLTLGIVLLEVGWRLGLPLEGVSFPGHFLVRFKGSAVSLLIDPFDGGQVRFQDQAQEVLDRVYGGVVKMRDSFLREATRRDMLVRLLSNLKGVYTNVGDTVRALSVVERLLLLSPAAPDENRARGVLLARLGRHAEAADQLEEYLRLAPDARDADRLLSMVRELREGRWQPTGGDDE